MTAAFTATLAALLAASAIGHLRAPRRFAALLRTHGVLPRSLSGAAAGVLIALELVVSGALLTGLLAGPGLIRWASAAASLLCAGFAVYLHRVSRHHPGGVPCGCGLGEAPAGLWTTLRAALLALLALCSALWPTPPAELTAPQLVTVALATIALSIALVGLPLARGSLTRVQVG